MAGSQESSAAGKSNTPDALQSGLQTMMSLPLSGTLIRNKEDDQRTEEVPPPG